MSTETRAERPDGAVSDPSPPFWLRRVRLWNYKSVAFCDLALTPMTILVGRNGAGKSNILDALAFVGELASRDIRDVINDRAGPSNLLRRCEPIAEYTRIEIVAELVGLEATRPEIVAYRFEYDSRRRGWTDRVGEFVYVASSGKSIFARSGGVGHEGFGPDEAIVENVPASPGMSLLGVLTEPVMVYFREGLRGLRRYAIQPDAMRPPSKRSAPTFLKRDGSNAAAVHRLLVESGSWRAGRLLSYLQAVVPQVADVRVTGDDYERLEFLWRAGAGDGTWFPASAMSDGTLRAFGVLLAALQTTESEGDPSVILLEEPEAGLHPAAVRALVDALDEASLRVQVIVATHSPELLDAEGITPDKVRVVEARDGATVVGPVDEGSAEIVRRHLSTLGGLERDDQLEPDTDDAGRQRERQGRPESGT